ncbi:hypothetical protein FRB99_001617 [Tulasnella sp. 403]|nr:hypothetical protein FRB99_001617 [Tulasnella sp. 403]
MSHSPAAPQDVSSTAILTTTSTRDRMPCADFVTTGFCKYGDKCLFDHQVGYWQTPAYYPPYSHIHPSYPHPYAFNTYQSSLPSTHDSYSSTTSSSLTSPSSQSVILTGGDNEELADSHLSSPEEPTDALPPTPAPSVIDTVSRQSRPSRHRKKPGNQKARTRPRRRQRAQWGEGALEYYTYLTNPFLAQPNALPAHQKNASIPVDPRPSGAFNVEHLILKSEDDSASVTSCSEPTEDMNNNSSVTSRQLTSSISVTHIPLPISVSGQHPFFHVPIIIPPDEIYDFDDEVSEPESVIVETPPGIAVYQGSKVGVLGGGVKLGKGKRPPPSPQVDYTLLNVTTKGDIEFDSDIEMETTSNRTSFVIVAIFTARPDCSRINEPSAVDATEVPLPPSPPDEETPTLTIMPAESMDIDPPSPSTDTPASASNSGFSWADDEDDGSFLSEPVFGSTPNSSKPDSTASTQPVTPSESSSVSVPDGKQSVPIGSMSYASILAAGLKASAKASAPLPKDTSKDKLPLPQQAHAPPVPQPAPQPSTTKAAQEPTSRKAKDETTRPPSFASVAASKQANDQGGRPAKMLFSSSDAKVIDAAPVIYGKLGFNLSPTAAREVELLRILQTRKLKNAAKLAVRAESVTPNGLVSNA